MSDAPLYIDYPPPFCDCCKRMVMKVRSSIWHAPHRICNECFFMWYDPDEAVDQTDPVSIGNAVRRKLKLEPLPRVEGRDVYTAANGEELPKDSPGTSVINDGRPT